MNETAGRHTGRILFYLPDKGFGYVRLAGTYEEFHFRAKNLSYARPAKDDLVTFRILDAKQGYYADDIQRLGLA